MTASSGRDKLLRMSADIKARAALEHVIATNSGICFLEVDRAVLSYHGYDIYHLARRPLSSALMPAM